MAKRIACGPDFGQVLRRARSERGKTQATVAEMAEISTEFYARLERGRGLGSLDTVAVLRQILDFDANELIAALGAHSTPVQKPHMRKLTRREAVDIGGSYKVFANVLHQARLRCQLTQEAVASSVQCTENYFYRIEAGRTLPSVQLFARLHHLLAFDANRALDALYEDPPVMPRYHRVGAFISDARKQAGETVMAVAQAVGCSLKDYKSIEAGSRLPTLAELVRLHGLLRFSGSGALRRIRLCEDDG